MSAGRKVSLGVGLALAFVVALGYWRFYRPIEHAVSIGAGMLAKQICSCVYVAGRDPMDCRADQLESMDRVEYELLSDPDGVRAFVPLFGERRARFRDGFGCALVD